MYVSPENADSDGRFRIVYSRTFSLLYKVFLVFNKNNNSEINFPTLDLCVGVNVGDCFVICVIDLALKYIPE